jgi:SAM-dependent methyltransferase
MPETHFDEWIAAHYETLWPELFEPAVVESTVSFLAALASSGPALEFGIGTGRIAVPLSHRNVRVYGIELSSAMVARLRAHPDSAGIDVTLGDFATTTAGATAGGTFELVYLLRNTITNLTTQDEQAHAFANAAAHLSPGGCFVIENYVPELQRLPPGETTRVFTATPDHLGYEQYDVATQTATSHHYWTIDGRLTTIALIGNPSARRSRRISAQSSTDNTPSSPSARMSRESGRRGSIFGRRSGVSFQASPTPADPASGDPVDGTTAGRWSGRRAGRDRAGCAS